MAGASLTLTVDDQLVRRAIQGLLRQSLNLKEPLEEIGSALVASTQQRFEDEESPEGHGWAPLSEAYQAKQLTKRGDLRGSDHILREQGDLYRSITYLADRFQLQVGSNRIYAAIHQLGGTSDMPAGAAAVPARAYLGLSHDDEQEIGAILMDHLGEPLS